MMKMKKGFMQGLFIAVAVLAVGSVQAQTQRSFIASTGDWSDTTKWTGSDVPDSNGEYAFFGWPSSTVNVDANFTINHVSDGFQGGGGAGHTVSGPGTLTIDVNSAGATAGFKALTGNDGAPLLFDGGVTIANSGSGNTTFQFGNAVNTITFGANSTLTLDTILQTLSGGGAAAGSTIEFNGTLGASSANLVIGSDNVSFGDGHDSSGFGKDIVFFNGAKLAVNGGTVLNSGRKIQGNGSGELELNGENAINDMNINIGGANDLLIDANAGQDDMGFLQFGTGTMTIDVEGASLLAFDDCSANTWGGAVVISNFSSGVVSFGTTSNGITSAQFAAITAYDRAGVLVTDLAMDENGFLTGTVTASQKYIFNNDSVLDSSWSNTGNWSTAVLPGPNDYVQLNSAGFDMDIDATVKQIFSSFGTLNGTSTSSGGTLTVDIYSATDLDGIWSAYGASNLSSTITFDGNVVIDNSLGEDVDTLIGVKNNQPAATLAFGPNSVLTLNSRVQTFAAGYGTIELNGTLLGSQALRINSGTVLFGAGHDSSTFGADFVVIGSGSKLVVDGGTVLAASRKVQINADCEIELNGADAFNAYISMINNKQLLVDVNADQNAMGRIIMGSGDTLTLDLAGGLTKVAFAQTTDDWQDSALVISNFVNGVVSFGTDTNGLPAANLDNIQAYDSGGSPVTGIELDSSGHLTTDTSVPVGDVTIGLINGGGAIGISWASTNGASYGVSNTLDLVDGPWTLLTNGVVGTGGTLTLTNLTDQDVEFFKVFGE